MITGLIIAIVFAFGALVCYAAVYVGARADRISERYGEEHGHEFHGQDNDNDN